MNIEFRCLRCAETARLTDIPEAGLAQWREGQLIQKAMPTVPTEAREALMMNWCLTCVDEVYRQFEEEEDSE